MIKELVSKFGGLANALHFVETLSTLAVHLDPKLDGAEDVIDEVCEYLQSLKAPSGS